MRVRAPSRLSLLWIGVADYGKEPVIASAPASVTLSP